MGRKLQIKAKKGEALMLQESIKRLSVVALSLSEACLELAIFAAYNDRKQQAQASS